VHDIIKRCHKLLVQYEEKLHLMETKLKMEKVKNSILNSIDLLNVSDDKSLKILLEMKKYIIDNV